MSTSRRQQQVKLSEMTTWRIFGKNVTKSVQNYAKLSLNILIIN